MITVIRNFCKYTSMDFLPIEVYVAFEYLLLGNTRYLTHVRLLLLTRCSRYAIARTCLSDESHNAKTSHYICETGLDAGLSKLALKSGMMGMVYRS